ncbi:MAG: hypothetical protein PHX45_01590 [Acidobacteriota bacterium]|nr:hypothetical protein [Acidobacteriota bacterium]
MEKLRMPAGGPCGSNQLKNIPALVIFMCAFLCLAGRAAEPRLNFACAPANDLYILVKASGVEAARFDDPAEAVAAAAEGSAVLVLADGYPDRPAALSPEIYGEAARKRLRMFVEYPSCVPGIELGEAKRARWERTVVASDAFEPGLERLRILLVPNCHFLPVAMPPKPHLVLARVAGYDRAVLGIPDKDAWPLLFEVPGNNLLVATTKLSQFITGRCAPADAWGPVWETILRRLAPADAVPALKWTPVVRPSFARNDPLPAGAELGALRRGADWYAKARLFVHPDWQIKLETMTDENDRVYPGPTADMPVGDGSLGLMEGFSSSIAPDGSQPVRWYVRNDCNGEVAMSLALSALLDPESRGRTTAANILDYLLLRSPVSQGPRSDPASPSFGLLGWDTRPNGATVYYGDDNARGLLGDIAVSAALKTGRWDERILRGILGNFRTTGPSGYRNPRIEEPELQELGWRHFRDESDGYWSGFRHSPHYQGYVWAMYLWLYDKTHFEPLLRKTESAIRLQMELYPGRWDYACNNQIDSEWARMLLPLAWLVRVDDTAEHRGWLKRLASDFMALQDPCGAVPQRLVSSARKNEEYGTGESSIIHANGDPCADLLYTLNFAFIGLHEAAAALGESAGADTRRAEDRLADFLVRIQAGSEARPEFDGVWFRAFDYRRWDYWGSNGDAGWGAWSAETGWTQGWIVSVLALRALKTSLWEFTAASRIARLMPAVLAQMLPAE